MPKKILLFQYNWLLQNYSIDLAVKLKELGFEVYFLGFNITKYGLSDISQFKKADINFVEFVDGEKRSKPDSKSQFKKYWFYLLWYFYKLRHFIIFNKSKFNKGINRSVLFQTHVFLKNKTFDYFIGIEKQGINWAGIFAQKLHVPLVYYSLELFVEDMENHNDWIHYSHLRPAELYYHKRSDATIIQDKLRADVIEKYNKTTNTRLYLPVSVRGEFFTESSNYFQDKFGIPSHKFILLYFGVIGPYRFCEEIVRVSPHLPTHIQTVFHGIDFSDFIETKIKNQKESNHVSFSLDIEPESRIPEIIASAHIGLALYHLEYLNDRHIAYSSQKIAYYFKSGIPIIAFKNESFLDLYSNFKCVRMIEQVAEIPLACAEIIADYAQYRSEAFKAYEKLYRFENVSSSISDYFK